jgi:hypothetical protein
MPASVGLRARPTFGIVRSGNARRIHDGRVHLGQSLRRIPMALLAPLTIVAGLTAGFALNSIHTIHTEEVALMGSLPPSAQTTAVESITTGTVTPRK